MSSAASRSRDEQGQAAVELALSLPLIALVLAGLVQVGLVVRDQVLVVHAARGVARDRAVDKDAKAAHIAQTATGGALDRDRLTVEIAEQGGRIRARVGYRAPIRLPLARKLVPDVPIAANAEVRSEID